MIGCLDGPQWCVEHSGTLHRGEQHESHGVTASLWQSAFAGLPWILVDSLDVPLVKSAAFAHLMAVLGHAELAAAVTRLAELGSSEARREPPLSRLMDEQPAGVR